MIERKMTVPKTARYFASAEPSREFTEVVFVCHGYAQLASVFLSNFDPIVSPQRLIIAPEGLHRFYQRGARPADQPPGRGYEQVVASWMTKEDRLSDIADYVSWLDACAADVLMFCRPDIKVSVLGFSQGAATVSRWAAMGMTEISQLILWCGFFPPDLPTEMQVKCNELLIVTATDDKFIDKTSEEKQLAEMSRQAATYKHIRFTGGHEVHAGTLSEIFSASRG